MEKRTLYALVGFAVVGLAAFLVMRAPEKGQRSGPRPRPIEAVKAADLTTLDITTDKGEKTTLEKSGTAWRVKAPKDWPADNAAIKTLTDGLEKMTFGDLVTESKDKHEEMGVADGKATHLVAKGAGGKTVADLYVGKNTGGFVMVRPAGKDEVWQSSGLQPFAVNKDSKGWRDHIVMEFAANDADKLTVDGGGAQLVLEKLPAEKDAKPGEPAKWKIDNATGGAPKTSDALDLAMVNGAIQALSSLHATDFADDKGPTDTALGTPSVKLTVDVKGKPYVLSVGAAKGDDVYVQAEGNPTVHVVKKYALERADHRPVDFRDKTLTKVKEMDLASVEIATGGESLTLTHDGDKWKSTKPVDDGKLKPVVTSFENLAGGSMAEEKDPAKTGLAKPTGTVTLKLKNKSTIVLKVGALNKEGSDYFVQRVGSPDVVTMKKYLVDRFLKKPADLAPATKTAAAPTKKK
jgi:hypothetical protein